MNEIDLGSQHYKDLSQTIANLWDTTRNAAWQGQPYRHIILQIKDILKDENQLVEDRKSSGLDYDFEPLNRIVGTHNHNYSWLERTLDDRNNVVKWWQNHLDQELASLNSSVADSRKLVLLTHGAAMLTSMTALETIQNSNYSSSFLTVAFGALLGFCVAIAGHILWIECYGDIISTLKADFKASHKITRFRAYRRYLRLRWDREIKRAILLTYASVIIFPLYSALAISIAVFAK